jgi:hypothetical protein
MRKTKTLSPVPRADTARFTADSKYAVFMIRPFYKDLRQAKIKKKKQNEFPKDTLGIALLGSRSVEKIPAIRSFKIAEKASVIAYSIPCRYGKETGSRRYFKKSDSKYHCAARERWRGAYAEAIVNRQIAHV